LIIIDYSFQLNVVCAIAAATCQARDIILAAIQSLDDVNGSRTCSAESLIGFVMHTSEALERVDRQIANHRRSQGLSLFEF